MVYRFELTYAAFLFPAIPLMMISFNNRYTSLSRLIRKIHDEFINKKISKNDKSAMRYLAQIDVLNKRLVYVKLMQLFSGLSFFFNLLTILIGIYGIIDFFVGMNQPFCCAYRFSSSMCCWRSEK